jgi:hypothetical protein
MISMKTKSATLALLVVASLVTPAAAQAITLQGPDPAATAWFQAWADRSLIPTARTTVRLALDQCGDTEACIDINTTPFTLHFVDDRYLWTDYANDPSEDRDRISDELNFMHELGHVLDFSVTHHAYRNVFMRIMRFHPWRVDEYNQDVVPSTTQLRHVRRALMLQRHPGDWNAALDHDGKLVWPDELFADAYAYCSRYPNKPDHVMRDIYHGYGWNPNPQQYIDVCHLLSRL